MDAPANYVPTKLERKLLDAFQRGLPLCPEPYAEMARQLGCVEAEVIDALEHLRDRRVIDRVGATLTPHRVGYSTLAAIAVPAGRIEAVAALVSAYDEVNHNYEREHRLNLWFVVTGADRQHIANVLDEIEARTGLAVVDLPLEREYRIDLGFPLQ